MTTQTLTLADFLLARIAEDEAAIPPVGDDPFLPHGQHWSEVPFPMASASRALAECRAKRAAVERLADAKWATYGVRDTLLPILAQPYADHPDFREEWRVSPVAGSHKP